MQIVINRKKYSLLFGMLASKTYHQRIEESTSMVVTVANIIYSGVVNYYYYKDRMFYTCPVSFADCYELSETLLATDPSKADQLLSAFIECHGSSETKQQDQETTIDWNRIEETAFGEYGLLPYDFYCMLPREYRARSEGQYKKWLNDERRSRSKLYLHISALCGKSTPPIYDLLPLPEDEKLKQETEEKSLTRLKTRLKKYRESKALQRAIEKINNNQKVTNEYKKTKSSNGSSDNGKRRNRTIRKQI